MKKKTQESLLKKMSSPRNVVGDLRLASRYFIKRFFPNLIKTTSAEDSRQKPSGMTILYNGAGVHAFTLIELLVVVLIIGILSAIALPQYQKAVMKTRYAQLKVLAKSLAEAEEIYHMATGSYSKKLADLDIQLSGGTPNPEHEERYNFPWGSCYLDTADSDTGVNQVVCSNSNIGMEYQQRLHFSSLSNQRICIAFNTDTSSLQNQVCKAETGKTGNVHDAFSSFRY